MLLQFIYEIGIGMSKYHHVAHSNLVHYNTASTRYDMMTFDYVYTFFCKQIKTNKPHKQYGIILGRGIIPDWV